MTFRFTRERPFHQHQIGRSGFELYYNFNPITKKAIQRTSRCLIDKQFFISFKDDTRKQYASNSLYSTLCFILQKAFQRSISITLTLSPLYKCSFRSFWNRIDKEKILQSFFFTGVSFAGTDDSETCMERQGAIFCFLYYFHLITNIQTIICNFGTEMTTTYF